MKKKKGRLSTILLVVIFLAGLSLLLYPSIANYWNSVYSTHAIADYSERTKKLTEEEYTEIWEAARNYNLNGAAASAEHHLNESDRPVYESLLNIDGNGVMGYIEIPSIEVSLPIYHGTSDTVLRSAVGHVEWSSLPVGGPGTHCVLSGHRGLPSAKLFTDLDEVTVGDVFMLRVLNEVLTYEVDQILIVVPEDTTSLVTVPGMDYCTLVTCTPYGINSHRLLVRGHRVETTEVDTAIRVAAEAMQVEPLIIATFIAVPLLLILLLLLLVRPRTKKKASKNKGGLK